MKAKDVDKKVEKEKGLSKGIDASSQAKPNKREDETWIAKVMISGPGEICEAMDLRKGDEFELILEDATIILIPKKNRPRSYKGILRSAEKLFGSEPAAILWLYRHQSGLGGESPVDVMRTQKGAQKVKYLLGRLLAGTIHYETNRKPFGGNR